MTEHNNSPVMPRDDTGPGMPAQVPSGIVPEAQKPGSGNPELKVDASQTVEQLLTSDVSPVPEAPAPVPPGAEPPRPAPPAQSASAAQKEPPVRQPSYFDGRTIQLIGWRLLGLLLTGITFGIGAPWAQCMIYRWQAKHTVVEGKRLHFDGRGHQLLGRYLLWGLLILVTFGIYIIFLPVRMHKWHVKHISFATGQEPAPRKRSGGVIALIIAAMIAGLLLAGLAGVLLTRAFYQEREPNLTTNVPTTSAPPSTAASTAGATEETTGASIWYVNSPTGLYVRDSAEEDYETIDYLEYGTQVTVEYWEGKLGFIGYGWCNGDYLTQTPPDGASQGSNDQGSSTQSGTTDSSILGKWTQAVYDEGIERLLLGGSYTFSADGTFSGVGHDQAYMYDAEEGWVVDYNYASGSQRFSGTYTFDGSALVLTYTYMEFENPPAPQTIPAYIQDGVLYLGSYKLTYYRGTVDEIAARLLGQNEEG